MAMGKSFMRIACCCEGSMVNAYLAQPHTMDGALLIGSVRKNCLDGDAELFEAFLDLMRRSMTVALKGALGVEEVAWGEPETAPEHERGGQG